MWDFSWLERRWPGAGYEDWDRALDELQERGYNAIRLDAYPHLVAHDAEKQWTLLPVWSVEEWGSPALNKVQVQPHLNQFMSKCKERKIWIGLSSWYRQDAENLRMQITTPEIMADQWIEIIRSIEKAGLLDAVLYVDLCNEWPGDLWAPYFKNDPPELTWGGWYTDKSMAWMKTSVDAVRAAFPKLPVCYSFEWKDHTKFKNKSFDFVDLFEPHIWMSQLNGNEYYNAMEYQGSLFDLKGYESLVKNAERVYRERSDYWDKLLVQKIHDCADISRRFKQPMVTTECWGIVNYKDWPLLNWDWIKHLCALGSTTAAETQRWFAISTSNFCGPQFVGMWCDIAWHQKLTQKIRNARVEADLLDTKLAQRMLAQWNS